MGVASLAMISRVTKHKGERDALAHSFAIVSGTR